MENSTTAAAGLGTEVRDVRAGVPLVAILVVMLVLSVGGNALVVCVFPWRLRPRTAFNVFVTALAVLDLLTSLLALPSDLLSLLAPDLAQLLMTCQLASAMVGLGGLLSLLLLAAIAASRYRAVCRPHWRPMSPCCALVASACALLLCLLPAWPPWTFASLRHFHTGAGRTYVTDCGFDEQYVGGNFLQRYFTVLLVMSFLLTLVLAALYFQAGCVLWRQNRVLPEPHPNSLFSRKESYNHMLGRLAETRAILASANLLPRAQVPDVALPGAVVGSAPDTSSRPCEVSSQKESKCSDENCCEEVPKTLQHHRDCGDSYEPDKGTSLSESAQGIIRENQKPVSDAEYEGQKQAYAREKKISVYSVPLEAFSWSRHTYFTDEPLCRRAENDCTMPTQHHTNPILQNLKSNCHGKESRSCYDNFVEPDGLQTRYMNGTALDNSRQNTQTQTVEESERNQVIFKISNSFRLSNMTSDSKHEVAARLFKSRLVRSSLGLTGENLNSNSYKNIRRMARHDYRDSTNSHHQRSPDDKQNLSELDSPTRRPERDDILISQMQNAGYPAISQLPQPLKRPRLPEGMINFMKQHRSVTSNTHLDSVVCLEENTNDISMPSFMTKVKEATPKQVRKKRCRKASKVGDTDEKISSRNAPYSDAPEVENVSTMMDDRLAEDVDTLRQCFSVQETDTDSCLKLMDISATTHQHRSRCNSNSFEELSGMHQVREESEPCLQPSHCRSAQQDKGDKDGNISSANLQCSTAEGQQNCLRLGLSRSTTQADAETSETRQQIDNNLHTSSRCACDMNIEQPADAPYEAEMECPEMCSKSNDSSRQLVHVTSHQHLAGKEISEVDLGDCKTVVEMNENDDTKAAALHASENSLSTFYLDEASSPKVSQTCYTSDVPKKSGSDRCSDESKLDSKSKHCVSVSGKENHKRPSSARAQRSAESAEATTALKAISSRSKSLTWIDCQDKTSAKEDGGAVLPKSSIKEASSSTMRKVSRTKNSVLMMSAVTLAAVLSYLPYLVLVLYFASVEADRYARVFPQFWFRLAMRSPYLRVITNPIAYAFCHRRFQRELKHLVSRIKGFTTHWLAPTPRAG